VPLNLDDFSFNENTEQKTDLKIADHTQVRQSNVS